MTWADFWRGEVRRGTTIGSWVDQCYQKSSHKFVFPMHTTSATLAFLDDLAIPNTPMPLLHLTSRHCNLRWSLPTVQAFTNRMGSSLRNALMLMLSFGLLQLVGWWSLNLGLFTNLYFLMPRCLV
ncbi:hypothetical protein DFJ58DRAFT_841673 [Suillus subalutaceus]|uniref:uncharacterized protein n=1 Tax=Suillus subalutaceus TaxID=48586 RepID=UPI001B86FE3C|nr:uncharacterized protein DFJ58DRAFT_841673 [Suillus subalutaceus]KAG1853497.1 hypothetical protein DFJ58DRAFT_841673 [Suillus subalutaceus]